MPHSIASARARRGRRRQRRQRRHQGGFTLLELLITMAVTLFGLMGLLSLHKTLTRTVQSNHSFTEAIQVGQNLMEDLRAKTEPEMMTFIAGGSCGGTTAPLLDCTLAADAASTGKFAGAFRRRIITTPANQIVSGSSSNLIRVRIEVGWTDDGANFGDDGPGGGAPGPHDHLIALELIRTVLEAL